jgi:hypothetical protein
MGLMTRMPERFELTDSGREVSGEYDYLRFRNCAVARGRRAAVAARVLPAINPT